MANCQWARQPAKYNNIKGISLNNLLVHCLVYTMYKLFSVKK